MPTPRVLPPSPATLPAFRPVAPHSVSRPPEPAAADVGRYRVATPRRARLGTAIDIVGRLGSLVTLAALLVVAGAIGGLADGTPLTGAAGALQTATLGEPGP
ncbi:hypothetical protein [Pseudonocardia acidicola]|uniref:Uncharacterized protein n=1 Tax=Pseudonocardia acidicola TaxID=2724939 RepID=A0ABX1SHB3_9PSEU|nr:hypothetical protein [Pseudonocardia acidicola]NMI00956.1 hypothetical protein [Pseudonocardia acidicola]